MHYCVLFLCNTLCLKIQLLPRNSLLTTIEANYCPPCLTNKRGSSDGITCMRTEVNTCIILWQPSLCFTAPAVTDRQGLREEKLYWARCLLFPSDVRRSNSNVWALVHNSNLTKRKIRCSVVYNQSACAYSICKLKMYFSHYFIAGNCPVVSWCSSNLLVVLPAISWLLPSNWPFHVWVASSLRLEGKPSYHTIPTKVSSFTMHTWCRWWEVTWNVQ
jgi:hypothetical protein